MLRPVLNRFGSLGALTLLALVVALTFAAPNYDQRSGAVRLGAAADAQLQFGGTIGAFAVEGNQRFTDVAVIGQSGLAVGDPFDPYLLNDAIKALYATGNFSDVTLARSGSTLVVRVQETQFVNRIFFDGNTTFRDSQLNSFIGSNPTDPFSRAQVQEDVNTILAAYAEKGRYQTRVDPLVRDLGNGRVDITYKVTEGVLTRVGSVNFVGNETFSDSSLRRVVSTKQQNPIRNLTRGDKYVESGVAADEAALQQFYLNRGYADFEVRASQGALAADQSGFVVTFAIDEGPRYRVSDIIISSDIAQLDANKVKGRLPVRSGQIYKATNVAEGAEDVRAAAEDLGFGSAIVKTDLARNPSDGTLDVVYTISEGPRVNVERIDVRGNLRTRDYVIRREMRLAEGDGFSASSLRRSVQRIRNLGYFGDTNIRSVQGSSPDQAIVLVDVEEASTGSLNFGGGYSSANGATLNLSYNERNLLGRGQQLSVDLALGQSSRDFNLSFTEPWFLGREIAAGFDLFYSEVEGGGVSYDKTEYGGTLRMSYKLSERLSQGWSYTLKQTEVSNVTSTDPVLLSQVGKTTRSILGHSLTYNRLDSVIEPRDGYYLAMNNQMAGNGIGGDVDWFSTTVRGSYYVPLGEYFTLKLSAKAGQIESLNNSPVPIVDRFFMGQNLVRGFAPAGISPRTAAGDAVGATTYYGGSAEVIFPFPGLADNGVSGRFFVDAGSAYDKGSNYTLSYGGASSAINDSDLLRSSYGVGITWRSPFGPLNLDWGFPIDKETFDVEENFQFSFGIEL